jgi:hypothetical protein
VFILLIYGLFKEISVPRLCSIEWMDDRMKCDLEMKRSWDNVCYGSGLPIGTEDNHEKSVRIVGVSVWFRMHHP